MILLGTGCQKNIDEETDKSIQALRTLAAPEVLNDPAAKPSFCIGIRLAIAGLLTQNKRISNSSLEWLNSMANHCGIDEYEQQ